MHNATTLRSQLVRAQSLQQAGRASEAWAIIAPLRAAIGNDGQALRLYALIAQQSGQIDPAAEALRRIIRLEHEPPEIVGALADMLGTAGRHSEALALWTRLTLLLPKVADAHLNRVISAGSAGEHDTAIIAADDGLRHFPGHPRLLAAKAAALKNMGRIEESVDLFKAAVANDPNHAPTRHDQAVALRAACRFDEACAAFAATAKLGMTGAQFHSNWAAAALEAGHVDDAANLYRRGLASDPSHRESKMGLTRLLVEYRGGVDAFAHYEQIAVRGNRLADWIDHAAALHSHRQYAQSAEVAGEAIARFGEDRALVALHATSTGIVGDAAAALERLDRAFAGTKNAPLSSMATLALRSGNARRAARIAEQQTALNPDDQGAWATLSLAWRLLDDPREHWLCDYERLIMIADIPSPDAAQMAAVLKPLHQTTAEPGDQSLRRGTQTSGALFARPDPVIQRFRDAVLAAAEKAVAGLGDDPTHPFLRRKSNSLKVIGSWSVRLSPGGHHVPHMHSQGWMSSAYYAQLPLEDSQSWSDRQGWIQFGMPPAMFDLDLAPRRIVEPRLGRLVLFPSYLWHGTLPFEAGDRLTAAFDFLSA